MITKINEIPNEMAEHEPLAHTLTIGHFTFRTLVTFSMLFRTEISASRSPSLQS